MNVGTVKLMLLCHFQTHFLSSALDSDAQWTVPVTLCVSSYENQKRFLLEAKNGQLDLGDLENVEETWWIKINAHQAGFYRVKYDENLEAQLRKAIANNCLSASDEFGWWDSLISLFMNVSYILSCFLFLFSSEGVFTHRSFKHY